MSQEAHTQARETLEGFFAHIAAPAHIEYTVLAGVTNHTGDWPLLLYVCVHGTDLPPQKSLDHVVVLTSTIGGHYFQVAEMLGGTLLPEPAALNATFPRPLRQRVQACLKVPAPAAQRD